MDPQVTVGRIVHIYLHPANRADDRVGPYAAIVTDVNPAYFSAQPFSAGHHAAWRMPPSIQCKHGQGFKADDWVGASLPPVSWEFPPRS